MRLVPGQVSSLADLNASLLHRVAKQVKELERLSRLRQFLSPEIAQIVMAAGSQALPASHGRKIAVIFCDLRASPPLLKRQSRKK